MSTKKELGIGDWAVDDYDGMFPPRIWSEKLGIEIDVDADQDVCIEHPGCDPAGHAWGGGCSTSTVYVPLEVLAEVLRRNSNCGPTCLEPTRRSEPISPPPDEVRERAEKTLAALKAGLNALGMHGPCTNNSCSECARAARLMTEAKRALEASPAPKGGA